MTTTDHASPALLSAKEAPRRTGHPLQFQGSVASSQVAERVGHPSTGKLTFTLKYVLGTSDAWLASAIAHDGEHVSLFQKGGVGNSRGLAAETQAMQFQLRVGAKLGLSQAESNHLKNMIQNPKQLQPYINSPP